MACNNPADKKTGETAKNTDLIQMNFKGKVQNFSDITYPVDSTGKTGKEDYTVNANELNDKGYITKTFTKDTAGKVLTETTISHYDNGNFKEMTTMKDGKQTYKLTTEIDKDGKYTTAKSYDSTGKQDSYYKDIAMNEYGIVYAGTQYGMNDKIKSTWSGKYDKASYIGGTSTDSAGKTSYTGTVVLNDKGDAGEETSTTLEKDSTKTEKMTYMYEYDDKGNWIQRTTYNEKGKPSKIIKRTINYYKE